MIELLKWVGGAIAVVVVLAGVGWLFIRGVQRISDHYDARYDKFGIRADEQARTKGTVAVEDPTPPEGARLNSVCMESKPCRVCGARTKLICNLCDRYLCTEHVGRVDEVHPCSWATPLACPDGGDGS